MSHEPQHTGTGDCCYWVLMLVVGVGCSCCLFIFVIDADCSSCFSKEVGNDRFLSLSSSIPFPKLSLAENETSDLS